MRRLGALIFLWIAGVSACRDLPPPPAPPPSRPRVPPPPIASSAPPAAPLPSASAEPEAEPLSPDAVTPEDAERVLFWATDLRTDGIRQVCSASLEREKRIRCLIAYRFEDDPDARKLALTLYAETGSLAGLLPEELADDGKSGKVRLLPARPIGLNRDHLTWILAAFRDYQRFLRGLSARGAVTFHDRPVHFRFFYSERGGNPSAFAVNRNIGYNLYGALNVSEGAVRDTLFHEIFHVNEARHEEWSKRVLAPLFDQIVARCGQKSACLSPYSPTDTLMRGFFYAFIPQQGAREYAAELAVRYYREQRLLLEGKELPVKPFKCGPPENLTAWQAISAEFFGGVDLVPACSAKEDPAAPR